MFVILKQSFMYSGYDTESFVFHTSRGSQVRSNFLKSLVLKVGKLRSKLL